MKFIKILILLVMLLTIGTLHISLFVTNTDWISYSSIGLILLLNIPLDIILSFKRLSLKTLSVLILSILLFAFFISIIITTNTYLSIYIGLISSLSITGIILYVVNNLDNL